MALKGKVNLVEVKYDRAFTEESIEETQSNMFGEGGWMDCQTHGGKAEFGVHLSNKLSKNFAIEIDNELNMILFTVESLAEFVRAKKMVEATLEYEEEE